jgi:hypothetical protein
MQREGVSMSRALQAGVFLANAFGAEQADTVKEEQLCVPATVPLVQ